MTATLAADTNAVVAAVGRDLRRLRRLAVDHPWHGRLDVPQQQRHVGPSHLDPDIGVSLLLSYDTGYHASGWWANSQYDSCWHASIVCLDITGPQPVFTDPDDRVVRAWMHALFGQWMQHAWTEPPASKLDPHRAAAASPYTTHVRIFTDRGPLRPITPTGEVYNLLPWDDGTSPAKVFRRA